MPATCWLSEPLRPATRAVSSAWPTQAPISPRVFSASSYVPIESERESVGEGNGHRGTSVRA